MTEAGLAFIGFLSIHLVGDSFGRIARRRNAGRAKLSAEGGRVAGRAAKKVANGRVFCSSMLMMLMFRIFKLKLILSKLSSKEKKYNKQRLVVIRIVRS